jgi:hypothetical protein
MNQQEPPEDPASRGNGGNSGEHDHSVANKLSEELSNWRRRRHAGPRQRNAERPMLGNYKSEPARTIKVRGHETLVIRKPKSALKPPASTESTNQ